MNYEEFMVQLDELNANKNAVINKVNDKQKQFSQNLAKDPVSSTLKKVYDGVKSMNPLGMVKGTFNQSAADGTLDGAKKKGLV